GNSWLTVSAKNGKEEVSDSGWLHWENQEAVFSTYIGINKEGELKLSAMMSVPSGKSIIECRVNGVSKRISLSGAGKNEYGLGVWNVKPGYIKVDMQGISKTGNTYATIKELLVSGSATNENISYVKNNEDNYFYWGRRGPSVHINYDLSEAGNAIKWFYNEITVPQGYDPVGSYFMADGFAEGYFGMQVNSSSERRILFSVWSPFNTDDPSKIPDDKKIKLLKKGKEVYAGEFGNEGSGGQSYLRYNWKAGRTYRFLLKGEPVENNGTDYTAYFYAPEENKWLLIASFRRPSTHTYLTRLHSFLENFEPNTGYITRKAFYQNQWIVDSSGNWKAIGKMIFTGDATAGKGYRKDYAGGVENGAFFLQNCGFFNDSVVLKSHFSHEVRTDHPSIDFSMLE
ncbi:MAG TPA: DUF3472 domain-containing protein, partial [Chitinophagaceae bacterium]|nr:DUF3472 domain-containing protein [Chitinophagaceae bacterium]